MTGRAANLLPILLILISLSACTPKSENKLPPDPATCQSLEEPVRTQNDMNQREALPPPQKSGKIDVDLTKMNANMIYSYIFEMVVDPDSYTGKTIKVKGFFYTVVDDDTGERYFAVIIPDALACCKQGMEFKWLGEHTYPDDYPQQDQEITITGSYRTDIMEGDISYSYLEVSELSILK